MALFAIENTTERPTEDGGDTPGWHLQVVDEPPTHPEERWSSYSSHQSFSFVTKLTVSARGRQLPYPLPIEVRHSPDYVSIADPASGVHGVGATTEEALKDFFDALLEFRDTLARQDRLAPGMSDLLAYTAALI